MSKLFLASIIALMSTGHVLANDSAQNTTAQSAKTASPHKSSGKSASAEQKPTKDRTGNVKQVPKVTQSDEKSSYPEITAECRTSSVNCPVTGSSGSSVIKTDSLPIGSTMKQDGPLSESKYPTSPGTGSIGSGSTGTPAGPDKGPTLGTGR